LAKKTEITVVGSGYVGMSLSVLLAQHNDVTVLDLLENTVAGVGGEIQLTDALDALLNLDDLNSFETDAAIFDCGNKQGLLSANLTVAMRP